MLVFEGKTNSTLNGWEQIDMHSKERFECPLTQNTTLSAQPHCIQENLSLSAASTGSSGDTNTAALSSRAPSAYAHAGDYRHM